jgi:hypothetical protein
MATAYGVATSAMNLSLTIVPLLTATIEAASSIRSRSLGPDGKFVAVELFFSSQAIVASIIAGLIWRIDLIEFHGQQLQKAHYMK